MGLPSLSILLNLLESSLYTGFKAILLHNPQFADKKENALKIREKVNKRANIEY